MLKDSGGFYVGYAGSEAEQSRRRIWSGLTTAGSRPLRCAQRRAGVWSL